MNSSLAPLWESAFVKIDEVWNALNVVAIGDSHLFFSLFEPRRDRIAPSELRCKSVPDKEVAVVQAPSFFETPFQNFFVGPSLFYALAKMAMMHAQKITAHTVRRSRPAEVLSIIYSRTARRQSG